MHQFGYIISYLFIFIHVGNRLTLILPATQVRGPKLWNFPAPDYDRQFTCMAFPACRNWRTFLLLWLLSFGTLYIVSYCETTQRFWKLGLFPSSAKGWGRHRLCCFLQDVEVKGENWTDLRGENWNGRNALFKTCIRICSYIPCTQLDNTQCVTYVGKGKIFFFLWRYSPN
jgi:hypothetical protein